MARPSPQTDRVVAVVDLLVSHRDDPLTLSEIARRLEVNKATCHAMLAALVRAGWLLRHPTRKTYRLGPSLAAAGRVASEGLPALEFARPAMLDLSRELGLACLALEPSDGNLTVLDEVGPAGAVRALRIGEQIPVRPPFGSAFVPWSEPGVIRRWLDDAAGDPARRARYERVLDATRRRGFAVELVTEPEARLREIVGRLGESLRDAPAGAPGTSRMRVLLDELVSELPGDEQFLPVDLEPGRSYRVSTISAPVFEAQAQVVLDLTLIGFDAPVTGERIEAIGGRLVVAASGVSDALGARRA